VVIAEVISSWMLELAKATNSRQLRVNPEPLMSVMNDDRLENWPVKFSLQQMESTCLNLAHKLPGTFALNKFQYAEAGCICWGFQLGDTEKGYVQLFIDFNSLEFTLRSIACRRSELLFCREQTYEIAVDRRSIDGVRRWEEAYASEWITTVGSEAVEALRLMT
jgi:hypothetical protein